MPDSGQPTTPNFVPGVGRLVTDRYDFEAHILGTNFRHNADAIDVIPGLVVNGQSYHNVLTALEALAAAAEPPVIAPATQTTLGVIQLTRDLGGTNGVSPLVIGLQGRSVSNQTPVTGNVLTWTGSAWTPSPITGLFQAGADLGGSSPTSSSTLQYVSGLTGSGGIVTITANNLNFSAASGPSITQTTLISGSGSDFNITAQGSSSGSGGYLVLQGGTSSTLPGSTVIALNNNAALQAGQVISGNSVLAIFPPGGGLNGSQMPANSGNGVIYIGNATAAPTSGTPTGGAILFGQSGQLWIKQSDSTTFQIGSIPDPSSWTGVAPGSLPISPSIPANGTMTYNVFLTTAANTPATAFPFAMPPSTSVRFDTIYVGKETGTGNTAQYNYSIGFVRNGSGAPTAIGTVTSSDSRTTGSWNAPSTTASSYISGNTINIPIGSSTSVSSTWTVVTQVVVSTA